MGLFDQLETFILLTSVAATAWIHLKLDGNPIIDSWPFMGEVNGESWTMLTGLWDLSPLLIPNFFATTEIKHSLAFVSLLTVIGTILSIPKAYYKNFVLEEKHGFNKMTRATFFADQCTGVIFPLFLLDWSY
jgi:STE24 endopeptidase